MGDIIANEEAIKVNQQWSGHPGMLVENILMKPVPYNPGGEVVPSNTAGDELITHHSLNFPKLNLTAGTYTVRDIWEKKDLGVATGQFPVTVPPYDSAFLLLSPDSK